MNEDLAYKALCEKLVLDTISSGRRSVYLAEMAPKVDYNAQEELKIEIEHREHGDVHYFKVYLGKNYDEAKKLCRISLLKPVYEPWHSTPGKTELRLTNKQVKWLVWKLGQINPNDGELTNLEYMIEFANGQNTVKIKQGTIKPSDYMALKN